MSIKSLLALLTLTLCATIAGCSVHVSFAPRNKPDAASLAKTEEPASSTPVETKSFSEKFSRLNPFRFDRHQEKLVDSKPLHNFLEKKQAETTTEQITVAQKMTSNNNQQQVTKKIPDNSDLTHSLISHTQVEPTRLAPAVDVVVPPTPVGEEASSPIEDVAFGSSSYPIDLPATLRLAGADNWNIKLAEEQINESYANYRKAKVMWIPSLNIGIGYTKHDGQIQGTNGQVIDVSRNSLFVGGGAITKNGPPLTGGAGGPARLGVDLSLTDAIFSPLAQCQLYNASRSKHSAAFNNALLEASLGYYDLVKAQGDLAIAKNNLRDADALLNMTTAFVKAGKGSRADISRAAVEVNRRKQSIVKAELSMQIASTNLVRILQLDPEQIGTETLLVALEERPLPVALIQETSSLQDLISQGHTFRPELSEQASRMEASRLLARAEHWRPYLPNVHMGSSVGAFGGGPNDYLSQLDGRSDVDLLAVWSVENMGFGTQARRRQMNSQYRQNVITTNRAFDAVSADVTNAWHTVHAQQKQMRLAEENIRQATESYAQNITRIRGLAGLPLEGLQALSAVADARQTYLNAVIAYNQAQLNLLRAIGRPSGLGTIE